MFPDLDNSSDFIYHRSLERKTLDIQTDDSLKYAALYEDLRKKREDLEKLEYKLPVLLPVGKNGVVNIRDIIPYDGVKFTNLAYMNILGRVPERGIVVSLSAQLVADSSREAKIKHLARIASSKEAKLKGAILTGFESIEIKELYQYSDREFIENLYIKVLWRKPDPQGEKHYLSLLRDPDNSPVEIIYKIRYSEEGKKKQCKHPRS